MSRSKNEQQPEIVRKPKAWEQQPGEGFKAFEAFKMYRDMGAQRSGAKVARALGKSKGHIDEWQSRYQWVARVTAFQDAQEHRLRLERKRALTSMAHRHAQIATGFQEKVLKRLKALNPAEMSVGECLRMFALSTKIESDARQIPTRDIIPQPTELEEDLDDYDDEPSQPAAAAEDAQDDLDEDDDTSSPSHADVVDDADAVHDLDARHDADAGDAPADPLAQAFRTAAARRAQVQPEVAALVDEVVADGEDAGAPAKPKRKREPAKKKAAPTPQAGGMRIVKGGAQGP